MTANSNFSFMSIGSQTKPATLVCEEFQQWKIRMVNFLEGIHPRITKFLHKPPYVSLQLVPRVPATATTDEVSKYFKPKQRKGWNEGEREIADLAPKCKRLLIIAIPNDIFDSLDNCNTSMDLWSELQRQLEGGIKVIIFDEDNNMLFLKSLESEWLHLTMSMRTHMDLESTTLANLYGTRASQEPLVIQMKRSIGGPLALLAEGRKGKKKEVKTEVKKKKKKDLMIESGGEEMSS
ncbi:hypothetical protein OSB04_024288 [Centaurea solstitialis]|uniref:Uncharacterized protein n=1 Tax=Centaurea solstitialis TaxID=347529 RepID=A0AA38WDQ5_9ASTR|nr:hypothetical protein OSB04_024288 [Centaurea solstitialis]